MWNSCTLCGLRPAQRPALRPSVSGGAPRVCADCAVDLRQLACRSRAGLLSLYQYRGSVRELVLRVKVQSDHQALDLLTDLFVTRAEVGRAGAWADAVMACPSSLWGRLRGRLDVGHALGLRVARLAGKPLLPAAPDLYWRLRKRALVPNSGRHVTTAPPAWLRRAMGGRVERWRASVLAVARDEVAGPRLLLVDDVVTTGQTLREVTEALPAGCRVRALTLAAGPAI